MQLKRQIITFSLIASMVVLFLPAGSLAQSQIYGNQNQSPDSASSHVTPSLLEIGRRERQMQVICTERESDPLSSMPIDEMQSKPSLPITDPKVAAGIIRAQRLLPVARELVSQVLTDLGREYNIPEWRINAAIARVRMVTQVKAEVDLRDNASVYYTDQRLIHFGTIFLATLQSDEGMLAIISHEITHIADGRPNTLKPLFDAIAARAMAQTGLRIDGGRPEELTCDYVGVLSASKYIDRTPAEDTLLRRLARTVEHNCVDRDDTDEAHLSPRNTLRSILSLDATLAKSTNK